MTPLYRIVDIGANPRQDSDGLLQLGRESRVDWERISPSPQTLATDTQSNAAEQVHFGSYIAMARHLVAEFG